MTGLETSRPAGGEPADRSLVLVLGPGRSGTSTMAGVLAHSGYVVPEPIGADETNPLGFFESAWVVEFHSVHLRRRGVDTLDTDPAALPLMSRVATSPAARTQLRAWLEPRLEEHRRLVIKDPRLVWFKDLWVDVARDLGVEPGFVVMLRHPAEVSASRNTYYGLRELAAVAGWTNVALLTELITRGGPRCFVSFPLLTAGWRTEIERVERDLGLVLTPGRDVVPHPVDAFIDPGLRRMAADWSDGAVPVALRDLAERAHGCLSGLTLGPDSARVDPEQLDELRADYAALHAEALELVHSSLRRARQDARRKALRSAHAPAEQPAPVRPGESSSLLGRIARGLRRR